MARLFSVGGGAQTVLSAIVTLVALNPAAAPKPESRIIRLFASQSGSTTSAQARIGACSQVSVFPTVVGATPRCLNLADTTAANVASGTGGQGTTGINASAEGAGTKTTLWEEVMNVLNGYTWVSTPPEQVDVAAGLASNFALFFPAAAPTLSGWAMGMNFQEGN